MPQEMHLFEVSFNGEHELVLGGGGGSLGFPHRNKKDLMSWKKLNELLFAQGFSSSEQPQCA